MSLAGGRIILKNKYIGCGLDLIRSGLGSISAFVNSVMIYKFM